MIYSSKDIHIELGKIIYKTGVVSVKIALLSDIHGNYAALSACLKYINENNFTGIAFLGDYITDCPYPQKVIELLYKAKKNYKTWFIRGNREEYVINHYENDEDNWSYNSKTGSLLYTYENLTMEDIAFFKSMPITDNISIENCKPFSICHGSPENITEHLLPNKGNTNNCLGKLENDYLFCGHTHAPFHYEYKGKTLVNCGSVGMPINSQTNAQFVQIQYNDTKWDINTLSIPYNINSLLQDFEESGIYRKGFLWSRGVAETLKSGINYPMLLLEKATQLAKFYNEDLSEKHWQQAWEIIKGLSPVQH